MACAPLVTSSGVALNFIMMALYACLLAQAWNILGGFGGQFSFGHALFFGTGAYVQAIAQLQGINPWLALPLALAASAGVGLFVGALSFRYGLKGSYFALVTLAFAEVFRVVAVSVPFTGAGVGLMVPLRESAANMQFGVARRLPVAGAGAGDGGAAGERVAAPFALRRLAAGGARQRGRGAGRGRQSVSRQARRRSACRAR